MAPDERLAAGYPAGKEAGFRAKNHDVTDHSAMPDLVVIPDDVHQGLVVDRSGAPVSTPPDLEHVYAVGDCGKIHVALEHERLRVPGAIKHNTLLRGAPAYGAGEVRFRSGVVIKLNARSGTYQPPRQIEDFVRELLRRAGVTVEEGS